MKKSNSKTILITMGILLIVICGLIVWFRAIVNGDFFIPITDREKITEGQERTDTVLCYQKSGDVMRLVNLSYRQFPYYEEEYPAQLLENHDMQNGEFAEITYQAEYSVGGEDGHHAYIKNLKNWKQLKTKEGLDGRTYQSYQDDFLRYRTATYYPVVIYQQKFADFIVIPADEQYYLFTPDYDNGSEFDNYAVFDNYRKITKEIEINGKTKYLHTWVLCNDNLSDEEIQDALYQGHVTDNPDLFFVGYDSDYPFQFTANGFEQPYLYHMKKLYMTAEHVESCAYHLTADQIDDPDALNALPEDVQHTVFTNWQSSDDVLIFGGNCDENTFLTFDDNNRPVAMSEQTEISGYTVFYIESGFFGNICSGIAGE